MKTQGFFLKISHFSTGPRVFACFKQILYNFVDQTLREVLMQKHALAPEIIVSTQPKPINHISYVFDSCIVHCL